MQTHTSSPWKERRLIYLQTITAEARVELEKKLSESVKIADETERKEALHQDIRAGAVGRTVVDRATLAAELAQHGDVSFVSLQIVEDEIVKSRTQAVEEQRKLEASRSNAVTSQEIQDRLKALENQIAYNTAAKEKIQQASASSQPAETPATPEQAAASDEQSEKTDTEEEAKGLSKILGSLTTMLPPSVTAKMSKRTKAITGGAMIASGVALVVLAAYLFKNGSTKRKVGLAVGTVGIAALAAWVLPKLGFFQGIESLQKASETAKATTEKLQQEIDDVRSGLRPWEKYGLTEPEYRQAKEVYRTGSDGAVAQLRSDTFGLQEGEPDSKEYKLFMKDMEELYREIPKDGLTYCHTEVAADNYEDTTASVFRSVEQWIDAHIAEVMIGSIIATRLGILQSILRGAGSVPQKLATIANTMRKWGMKHKVASLFLFGAGAIALCAAARSMKKNVFMPKNFQQLSMACSDDSKEIVMGAVAGIDMSMIDDLKTHGAELVGITTDYGSWAVEQMGSLFDDAAEQIALTDEEMIAHNHFATFGALRKQLAINKAVAAGQGDREAIRGGELERYTRAEEALEQYQILYVEHRIRNISDAPELFEAYDELQTALADVDIELTTQNGVVSWKMKGDEVSQDLGVDPTITDKDTIISLSEGLDDGDWVISRFVGAAFQKFRLEQQDNFERFANQNKWVAMIMGNTVYFADPNNWGQYFMTTADVFWKANDESWGDWSASVGSLSMQTALFTIGPSMATTLVRRLAGSAPMPGKFATTLRSINRFIPITSQVELLTNMRRCVADLSVIRQFGPLAGRKFNMVFSRAHVRPEWIKTVAQTSNIDDLIRLAKTADVDVSMIRGMDLEAMRKTIQTEFITRMNNVKLRNWRALLRANVIGFRYGKDFASGEQLYHALAGLDESADASSDTLKSIRTALATAEEAAQEAKEAAKVAKTAAKGVDVAADATEAGSEAATAAAKSTNAASKVRPTPSGAAPSASPSSSSSSSSVDDLAKAAVDSADEAVQPAAVAKLLSEIDEAIKNGDDAALKALMKNPLLKQVAGQNEKAANLVRASKWASRVRYGGMGLSAIIGTALVVFKQLEINKEKNQEIKKLLLDERNEIIVTTVGTEVVIYLGLSSLSTGSTAATSVLAAAGTTILATGILVAPIVGAAMYNSAVRKSMKEWAKTSEDWSREDGATLLEVIEKGTAEGADGLRMGHRAAHGESAVGWAWRQLTTSRAEKEKFAKEQYQKIEKVNWGVRYEAYAAYFLSNSIMQPHEGESEADFTTRLKADVKNKMRYLGADTFKKYDKVVSNRLEHADSYAALCKLQQDHGDSIPYTLPDGTKKTLDLTCLNDVSSGKVSRELLQLVIQYEEEYLPHTRLMQAAYFSASLGESPPEVKNQIKQHLRIQILDSLRHKLLKTEQDIREFDRGATAQDVIRYHVHQRVNAEVDSLVNDMLAQTLTPEEYVQRMFKLKVAASPPVNMSTFYQQSKSPLKNRALDRRLASTRRHKRQQNIEKKIGVPVSYSVLALVPRLSREEAEA